MLVTDLIRRKRDGGALTEDEIACFVAGLADESIPAEQVSALAMAIFLNSMSADETAHLTMRMASSGTVLDWGTEGLDGPVVDKHSTGGVGDKVSFILAPIAAACGLYVPMISGRGLGHTGGTTDKAESIPGYDATPGFERFRKVVREAGCAIIGQTADLAPADRRLYAIRDVTATVESIPLITASILSKKIAAGLDALVMDIKLGNGAFMRTGEHARELADSIIATARKAGLVTHALITDMNQCLGTTAGNALEVAEAVRFLRNDSRDERLDEVVMALAAEMLLVAGLAKDRAVARHHAAEALTSGRAAEVFGRMVAGLGGPGDFVAGCERYLPAAPVRSPVHAEVAGYVEGVDTFALGNTIIELGGGRRRLGERLDLSVGLAELAPIGAAVGGGRPLAVVHARTNDDAERAADAIRRAIRTGPDRPAPVAPWTATIA
ncbi:MAG: thymidine phosphorylase [Gammaproteobacteria bacterium]|nr:thymidine phosphorylase [Gammaproteobacteria bacterium]